MHGHLNVKQLWYVTFYVRQYKKSCRYTGVYVDSQNCLIGSWFVISPWQSCVCLCVFVPAYFCNTIQPNITYSWPFTLFPYSPIPSLEHVQTYQNVRFTWLNPIRLKWIARGSSVSIAIHYGLEGTGFESRCLGEILRNLSERAWFQPGLLYNGHRVIPGVKTAWAWRWPPTRSSEKVKKRVDLYLFSPSGI